MDDSPQTGAAEVESVTDKIAIVTVRGEHDLGTTAELGAALAEAGLRRHVLVDLSSCAFMDSSALAVLLLAHRGQIERAGRFELVAGGAAHPVKRILKLASIDALVTIHETRSDGLAGLEAEGDPT
jgi:anti-anti-sigma factor